jgi:UDP-N-acetylglucosamine 1-carboxyvinyltransferase
LEKFVIHGGKPLNGDVVIGGAKNAAVAILPATILAADKCTIENLPCISDVMASLQILSELGASIRMISKSTYEIDTTHLNCTEVSNELSRQMRASYYFLGALLGRFGAGQVAMPGGCNLGPRPIDQHLKGFRMLGANVEQMGGRIKAKADVLTGTDVVFDCVSVGATINVMLAAAKAHGTTIIYNAAKEPHVVDLANFLNSMGARVKGAGTDVIRIFGRDYLHGANYTVIPDQIETGTLMIAAAATHGDVELTGCIPTHMEALSAKLLEMGARVTESDDTLRVRGTLCGYRGVNIKTQVYPGFPTDLQQPMSTLLTTAMGQSIVRETIFESRLKHLTEIGHMGAHVQFVDNATAIIEGVPELYGAPVTATDLRAGAALVIAGLMARGVTEIYEPEYIDRGYEHLEDKLCSLGAEIRREKFE